MKIINYLSIMAMPMVILIIILYGVLEKKNVFDLFIDGAKEGIKIVYNIFPTLVGLFVAVGTLRNSGVLDFLISLIKPVINCGNIPQEILPLAILRPISGSTSMAIATEIMTNYGVDSTIGKMASVVMGATETTLYTIAVYTSCVKIKKTRGVIVACLIGDVVGIITSIIICNNM